MIRISVSAEEDIQLALAWYGERSPLAVEQFENALESTLLLLSEHPLAFPEVIGRTRRAPLVQSPYRLLYVLERDDVYVLGCLHVRRHPRVWVSRALGE